MAHTFYALLSEAVFVMSQGTFFSVRANTLTQYVVFHTNI